MRSKTSKSTGPKSKAAAALELARVTEVFLWIVQGQTEGHILEAIREKWPDQEAQPLIAAALQQLQKSAEVDRRTVRAWCLEAYRELHRCLTQMGDFGGAIRAVHKIDEITRELDAPREPGDAPDESQAEAQARAHLAPLFEDGDSLPLPELARLAAQRIISQ